MSKFFLFLICIFEILTYTEFARSILVAKSKKKYQKFLIEMLMILSIFLVNSLEQTVVNLFMSQVILIIGTLVLFCDEVRKEIICLIIYDVSMIGCEFIGELEYLNFSIGDFSTNFIYSNDSYLLIIVTKLASYIILKIIQLMYLKSDSGIKGNLITEALVLPLTTLILFSGLFYADVDLISDSNIISVGCILLLFSNITVFYILEKLTSVLEKNKEFEIERVQYEINKNHYEYLEGITTKNRVYVHDMKQLLSTINGLAVTKQDDEIIKLLGIVENQVEELVYPNYVDNKIVNAIICEKYQIAKKKDVEMRIVIEPNLCTSFVNDSDMIVVLGNLIQNAIDAAKACEDGYVNVHMESEDSEFLSIIIENNFRNAVVKRGQRYLSAKRSYTEFGIGINSVDEIAKKYGGLLYIENGNNIFTAIVTMSKSYNERNDYERKSKEKLFY